MNRFLLLYFIDSVHWLCWTGWRLSDGLCWWLLWW